MVNDSGLHSTRIRINTSPAATRWFYHTYIRPRNTQHAVWINILSLFCSPESPEMWVECVSMCSRLVLLLAHAQTSHLLLDLGHLQLGRG